MIVRTRISEREEIQKQCALFGLKVRFYTIESNDKIEQAEIIEPNGDEVSPVDAWLLGRSVVWNLSAKMI